MKALPTQFDESRRATAVATPTCSSCCCCCCCLGTVVTSSAMLAQRIQVEGKREGVPLRRALTALAALVWPMVALLTGLTYALIALAYSRIEPDEPWCGNKGWDPQRLEEYRARNCPVATPEAPPATALWLAILFAIVILSILYWRVRMSLPVGRAVGFLLASIGAFAIEFVAGGVIVLFASGAGYLGVVLYLALAAFVSGLVIVKYGRGIRRASEARLNGTATIAVPPEPPGPPMPPMPPEPPGPPAPPVPPTPPSPPSPSSHPGP